MLPNGIVDLKRYPISDPDGAKGRELVESCREELRRKALCRLPGFILPQALEAIASESAGLEEAGYRYDAMRCAYEESDHSLPADHPRNSKHLCRYRQVLNDQIPDGSALRQLYSWPALTEFIRRVLDVETLHQSACPHLALTIQMSGQDDANGWHFDGNDFVVSLLLQSPESGGEFEYAPYVRSIDDECYEAVSEVLADPDKFAERPLIAPGTFTLFKGDLSLHRVRSIGETSRPRIIALFSYDERPGQVFAQDYIDEIKGTAMSDASRELAIHKP